MLPPRVEVSLGEKREAQVMNERAPSGGGARILLVAGAALGCLALVLGSLLAAGALLWLVRRGPPELVPHSSEAVDDDGAGERVRSMTVCAEERSIRLLVPTGQRVGLVRGDGLLEPDELARYGWVAVDLQGGFVRWWQPDAFASLDEAEQGIAQVLAYCEVCCASGTVRLDEGLPSLVWLEDPRFTLPGGVRVGDSFQAAVRAAPPGAELAEDEMDGLPTLSVAGCSLQASPQDDRIGQAVVSFGQRAP
jgi:hypothetical protein